MEISGWRNSQLWKVPHRITAFRAGLNLTTIPPCFGQTGVRFWGKPYTHNFRRLC